MRFKQGDLVLVHNVLDEPTTAIIYLSAEYELDHRSDEKTLINFVKLPDFPGYGFNAFTNRRIYSDAYPDAYLSEPTKEQKLKHLISNEG